MDNATRHNARKMSLELERNRIERASHPAYSPEASCYDFWYDFLKAKLKEEGFGHRKKVLKQWRRSGPMSLSMNCRTCSANGFNESLGSLSTKGSVPTNHRYYF
jgi:hypothetical protein